MKLDALARAGEVLSRGRTAGSAIVSLPEGLRPRDERDAYGVQEHVHRSLGSAGFGPVTGHKIGCTTPVMQRYLGIAQPCAGGVFAETVHVGEGQIRAGDYRRVGVECEIAVRLGADLRAIDTPHDEAAVSGAVDACMCAMEIVDDRYDDYARIGVMTLIADDFFNAGCVLGGHAVDISKLDLAAVTGRMWIDDHEVGAGTGADIMGHPLRALAWLADRYASLGKDLRRGEFVLLGSVVQTQWLEAGNHVRIEVEGLGGASLRVI